MSYEAPGLEQIEFRLAVPTDFPFICDTWLNNLYHGNGWFKAIPEKIYREHYKKVIIRLISKPNSRVSMACLKIDSDALVGYSVTEGDHILHYVFIKPVWRSLGIAKKIVPETVTTVTHLTRFGQAIKPERWIYNPFLI
jgi:hypothetical protein